MSWFLWLSGTAFLLGAALPLLIAPLRWGRALRWNPEPDTTGFATYLGRCLGGVTLVLVAYSFRAAPAPEDHPWIVELLLSVSALFAGIHILGAIEGRQPWTETLEIAMYIGFFLVGLWLYVGFR